MYDELDYDRGVRHFALNVTATVGLVLYMISLLQLMGMYYIH